MPEINSEDKVAKNYQEVEGITNADRTTVDAYVRDSGKNAEGTLTTLMKKSAEDLYDYAAARYPGKDIYVFGHSYGCGMAAYTASVRQCKHLVLASGYRTSADMYNKIIPLFWGPATIFITNK